MIGMVQNREDERLAQASAWIARLQSDDLTEADGLAFDAWLSADPENPAAYDAALVIWRGFDGVGSAVLAGLAAKDQGRVAATRRGWLVGAGGLAAAAAVLVALLPVVSSPSLSFATSKGEHRAVKLDDGSTVDMNAETSLSVTQAWNARRVVMGQGEAIFDVASDRRRPFTIQAGDHVVRVVGTQFDVRRRGSDLRVTVARGIVEVRPGSGDTGPTYVLRAGQRLVLNPARPNAKLTSVEPSEALGWRSGRLVYRDEPLANVVADLNRQFVKPIVLADAQLGQTPISGVLILDSQTNVVGRLSLMLPITAINSADGVLLRRK